MTGKRLLLIAGGVAGLAAAGFGGVYGYIWFSNRDAPPPVTLSRQTPLAAAAAAGTSAGGGGAASCDTAPVDGTWTVSGDGQSFGGYRVTEKLARLPARSDAVGRSTAVTGTLTVEGTAVNSASFTVDLTRLSSDERRRDDFIRHDGLESDRFPTATFSLGEPLALGGIPAQGSSISVTARGSLALHGVTRDVSIPLQGQRTCTGLEIVGSLPVLFSDYAMDPPSIGGFVSVDDHGTMEVKLELVRKA